MTDLRIDRVLLTLDGIPAETASAAVDGLAAELTRRLSVRGVDVAALSGLGPTVWLPSIEADRELGTLDAETLRGLIADGLLRFLSPPATRTADTEAE